MDGEIIYRPSEYVDFELTGRVFSPDELTLASFVAGTLREMILSADFGRIPKSSRRKIEHLSLLVHLNIRFGNFPLICKMHHCILDDINQGKTKWADNKYFKEAESNIVEALSRLQPSRAPSKDCPSENLPLNKPDGLYELSIRDCSSKSGNLEEVLENKMTKERKVSNFTAIENDKAEVEEDFGVTEAALDSLDQEDLDMDEVDEASTDIQDEKVLCALEADTKEVLRYEEECSLCQEKVAIVNRRSMFHHIQSSHAQVDQQLACPHCRIRKSSGEEMVEHMEREHKDCLSLPVACQTCGISSNNYRLHLDHIKVHSKIECQACHKTFRDAKRYKRHYTVCHESATDGVCPICGKTYKHIKAHIYTVHTEHDRVKCSVCDFSSSLPGSVANHFRRVHAKPEVCTNCNKTVKDLKRHLRRQVCFAADDSAAERRRAHKCEVCDKSFAQKYHLDRHTSNVHLRNRSHSCQQCSYKASNSFNLNLHVKRVHERKDVRTTCPFCAKQVFSIDFHLKAYHQEEMLASSTDSSISATK